MDIGRIGKTNYFLQYKAEKDKKSAAGTGYSQFTEKGEPAQKNSIVTRKPACRTIGIGMMGAYYEMKQAKGNIVQEDKAEDDIEEKKEQEADTEESKVDTDIIVKPDGSRVLVITTNIGGMETNMSLELSKPTDMANEIHQEDGSIILEIKKQYNAAPVGDYLK